MLWIVLGTVAIVLAVVGVGVALDRRWPLLPPAGGFAPRPLPASPPAPGATAATAAARPLVVGGERCCGAPMREAGDEPLVYDGRPLTLVRLCCDRCGATRGRYVT